MEYITNTEELTTVASAIRAKAGITNSIVYPSGFSSAIDDIEVTVTTPAVSNASVSLISGDDYLLTMS